MYTYEKLFDTLLLNKNDIVLLHTDFTLLTYQLYKQYKEHINFAKIIHALMEIVGNNGTILFPTFTWDFCKNLPFNYHTSPSRVGSITNYCLNDKNFKRTKHPIYSFAVWGKEQNYLCSLDYKDSFGLESIFHYLYEKKAKIIFINISYQHSATFAHYVEEKIGVPYRYIKNFTSEYINEKNESSLRTYSMYVRKLEYNVETLIDPMQEDFIQNNCLQEIQNDCGVIRLLDYQKACDLMANDIIYNGAKKLAKWTLPQKNNQ